MALMTVVAIYDKLMKLIKEWVWMGWLRMMKEKRSELGI